MQVYFVGSSAPQLELGSSWVVENSEARLPPNIFQGFRVEGPGSIADKAFGRFYEPASEFWFSFCVRIFSGSGVITEDAVITFYDVNSTPILRLVKDKSLFIILEYYNGLSWASVGGYEPLNTSDFIKLDIHTKFDAIDGKFELFINEESVGAFTGNNIFTESEEISHFEFNRFGTNSAGNGRATYSAIMCLSETTIGRRLANRRPIGQGHYDEWTGSYENISGEGYSPDVSVVGELNKKTSYTLAGLTDVENYTVDVVIHMANARRQNLNGGRLQTFVRYGDTDYEAAPIGIPLSYGLITSTMFQNPVTTQPWEVEDLNTAEIGITALPPL